MIIRLHEPGSVGPAGTPARIQPQGTPGFDCQWWRQEFLTMGKLSKLQAYEINWNEINK